LLFCKFGAILLHSAGLVHFKEASISGCDVHACYCSLLDFSMYMLHDLHRSRVFLCSILVVACGAALRFGSFHAVSSMAENPPCDVCAYFCFFYHFKRNLSRSTAMQLPWSRLKNNLIHCYVSWKVLIAKLVILIAKLTIFEVT
jgi:hypothetical protein